MTRELQRTLALLRVQLARQGARPSSVLAHVDADTILLLEREGVTVEMKDYPSRTRRRMARVGHALPDGSFPIADCADAEDAIRSQGRAKPEKRARVRAHIRKRVRALRCSGKVFDPYR